MNSGEILNELIALFGENIPEASFIPAYPGGSVRATRKTEKPVVTGEIGEEVIKQASEEVKLRFTIFLPESAPAQTAEDIFTQMCVLARQRYQGFSAISRGTASADSATGLLTVVCAMTFLEQSGGSSGGTVGVGGRTITVGGRSCTVTGVKTTFSSDSDSLVSIGETQPFAVLPKPAEYTVELSGIDVTGLDNLASFTVVLSGSPSVTYQGCRWKSLSDTGRKAVFVSSVKS